MNKTVIRKNENGQKNSNFIDPGQRNYSGTFLGLMLAFLFVIINAGAANAATYTVTNNGDYVGAGSLRQAIEDANSTPDNDIIEFDPSLSGQTITLLSSSLEIYNNGTLTINGLGANQLTISADFTSRVFLIQEVTCIISGITITNGDSSGDAISDVGGGILIWGGNVKLTDVTVKGSTSSIGGGIYNVYGLMTISNSTVSGNSADSEGGGIYSSSSQVIVSNSTISGNSAQIGGGITNENSDVTLINSTVGGNTAINGIGGGINNFSSTTTLRNTIVSNTGGDCRNNPVPGSTINAENSLIQSGLGCVNGTNNNNLTGDPMLGPLQDNGGPTFTRALLPGSPVIDAGSNALAVDNSNNPLLTDQRGTGFLRISNTTVDIGAFEVQAALPQYNFTGFFAPVENLPMVNISKAGSSIPIKFSLNGNQGLAIFAVGYPASSPIACAVNEPGNTVSETMTAGNSSLTYDGASDRYQYVWKTDKAWKGCRILVVRFIDGTEHYAKFRFK